MNTTNFDGVCDNCGNPTAKIRLTSRSFGKSENLLVIENVPVISCSTCGESYLTAETMREIERIRRDQQTLAVKRAVPVAEFS